MSASREELAALAAALEGALGSASPEVVPAPASGWRASWPALAGLGVASFCIPEALGGLGVEVGAALVASRAFGAALHGSPYPAIAAAAFALSRWLDPAQRAAEARAIASGQSIPAIAFLEPSARVIETGDGASIDGAARLVLGAGECDAYLVLPARSATMFFVRAADSCSVSPRDAFDVTRAIADVAFAGARGTRLASDGTGRTQTERLYGLLLAGDALGGVERMLERTRAHALGRRAFGRPLGAFQAVQHRLVDHALRVRGMQLLALEAADGMSAGAADAERRALLAEAAVATGAVHVLHDLLQLTGAIGFTWEHGLHLYERRSHLDARLGRNPRAALRALAALARWGDSLVSSEAAQPAAS